LTAGRISTGSSFPRNVGPGDRASRAALARAAYSYLHLPRLRTSSCSFSGWLVGNTLDVHDPLRIIPALGLCGGIALYLLAHVALRLRIFGRGPPVASVLLLGLLPSGGWYRPHRPRPRCGRLRVTNRLRGHPVSEGARLDPQPSRRVHHGRGRPCRKKPREGRPSSPQARTRDAGCAVVHRRSPGRACRRDPAGAELIAAA
jgi:hypothetical protein